MATQSAWVVDLNYIPIQSKNCEILASITITFVPLVLLYKLNQ